MNNVVLLGVGARWPRKESGSRNERPDVDYLEGQVWEIRFSEDQAPAGGGCARELGGKGAPARWGPIDQ